MARRLIQKNHDWIGPYEDTNYNGSEADIIVYICDESINIQTLARARRLLIILTCDTECNPATILMLQKSVSDNMADILSIMTKCNECGTIYNHVQNDQCPEPVIHPIFSLQYYFGIGMFFFVILIVLLIAILFRFKEDGFSYLYTCTVHRLLS